VASLLAKGEGRFEWSRSDFIRAGFREPTVGWPGQSLGAPVGHTSGQSLTFRGTKTLPRPPDRKTHRFRPD
jgi:hypothetical protein